MDLKTIKDRLEDLQALFNRHVRPSNSRHQWEDWEPDRIDVINLLKELRDADDDEWEDILIEEIKLLAGSLIQDYNDAKGDLHGMMEDLQVDFGSELDQLLEDVIIAEVQPYRK